MSSYEERVAEEIGQYKDVPVVHDLPGIYDYWSDKYIRPLLNSVLEADTIPGLFARYLAQGAAACGGDAAFLSIGSGDLSLEITVAKELIREGLTEFTIECTELSPALIERGLAEAKKEGLSQHILAEQADLNLWQHHRKYAAVMASHSLHHVLKLEHLFQEIFDCMHPKGLFVISDMIGRNGHMRWPEALELVHAIWAFLAPRYKYNHSLKWQEDKFLNWNCAGENEGFEGIRAQDILPLLIEKFHFVRFLGFGNLTDVFVDRSFGHNFDPHNWQDKALIDFLHLLNDRLLDAGQLKPTMTMAVMSPTAPSHPTICYRNRSPEFCVRRP